MDRPADTSADIIEIGAGRVRIGDALLSFAFLVVAIVFFTISVTTLRMSTQYGPGPGLIPAWASLFFGLISAATLIGALRKPVARFNLIQINPKSSVIFIGLIVLTALVIPYLGLLPSVALFFVLTAVLLENCPPLKAALVGLGVAVVLHVMLVVFLRLPLPMGVFSALGL